MSSHPPHILTTQELNNIVISALKYLLIDVLRIKFRQAASLIIEGVSLKSFISGASIDDEYLKEFLVSHLMHNVTGDSDGMYTKQLVDVIFKDKFIDTFKSIITDFYTNYYYIPNADSKIELVNKNFHKVHRSGWQYVVNGIQEIDFSFLDNNLVLDTFVDKTFHWKSDFYIYTQTIPYTSPWIGFIHHTFSTYGNEYNCKTLFENEKFLDSLIKCKGLIVFSSDLKDKIDKKLSVLHFTIPVYTMTHPTEQTSIMFTPKKFLANSDKKVIQIGNWLRDMFAIYRLDTPDSTFRKCLLKGFQSTNYLPPTNLQTIFDLCMESLKTDTIPVIDICDISFSNMWMESLFDYIKEKENSVSIIETLSDTDYDELLSCNVVFLKLIDSSAVNTLIECITRNTPILVNPLPAIIELLGVDYPMYFSTFPEATEKLNTSTVLTTYNYLSKMNKNAIDIEYFKTKLITIIHESTV